MTVFSLLRLTACAPPVETGDPPAVPPGPDILLVTIDTLRADRVGAYGDPRAQTPTLDALAREGVLFREVLATAPTTLPSHASLMTGRLPRDHKARDNAGYSLAKDVPTLAETLGARGWSTGGFVSASVLNAATGIGRGFATFSSPADDGTARGGAAERASADTVAEAVAWWRAAPAPRFGWVHLYDPHRPWLTSDGDPYRADVSAADAQVGALLGALGLAPGQSPDRPTLLVVTSDHGESLWEHGERDHGLLPSRAALRVPLLLRPPQRPPASAPPPARAAPTLDVQRPADLDPTLDLAPVPDAPRALRVVDTLVSGFDLAPTLADYAGVALPAPLAGRSLRPLVEGEDLPPTPAYAETWYPAIAFGWSPRCAVVSGSDWLLGRPWEGEVRGDVYDWQRDPGGISKTSTSPEHLELTTFARESGCTDRPDGVGVADPRLEALGYLAGAGELPEGDFATVLALLRAEAEPDPAQAARAYAGIVEVHPKLWRARTGLAVALAATGDLQGALAQLETPGFPTSTALYTERGALLLALGRLDDAATTAAALQAAAPQDPAGWRLASAVASRRGDRDGAERAAREGLTRAPEDPALSYALGVALAARGADGEALPYLLTAQARGSKAADLSLRIGLLHEKAGRIDDATASYAAHRAAHPEDVRGWAAPAWMLARLGRCTEATPLAEGALKLQPDDARMQRAREACTR